MPPLENIADYLRAHAQELGDRILQSCPPLHSIDDPPSPLISKLLRKPYPAQTLAIMGLVRRWEQVRAGAAIAECGTGKTLISLGAVYTHAEGRPFTAVAMVPPQLVEKWCRETFLTRPRVRVFIIDGLRTPTNARSHHGVNEVKLRSGRIVLEGLRNCGLSKHAGRSGWVVTACSLMCKLPDPLPRLQLGVVGQSMRWCGRKEPLNEVSGSALPILLLSCFALGADGVSL